MGDYVVVPPLLPAEVQVADRRLGARQEDEVDVSRDGSARSDEQALHAGLRKERIEVVVVGDPPELGNRHAQRARISGRAGRHFNRLGKRHRVLRWQAGRGRYPGHDTETPPTSALLDQLDAGFEYAPGSPELVDDEPGHHRRVSRVEHCVGTHQRGDHPAPVDVAHYAYRYAGPAGEAHVGDVAIAQVRLGRASRAFHDDEVVGCHQFVEAVHDQVEQPAAVP